MPPRPSTNATNGAQKADGSSQVENNPFKLTPPPSGSLAEYQKLRDNAQLKSLEDWNATGYMLAMRSYFTSVYLYSHSYFSDAMYYARKGDLDKAQTMVLSARPVIKNGREAFSGPNAEGLWDGFLKTIMGYFDSLENEVPQYLRRVQSMTEGPKPKLS